jgi:methyl-accepting chemotaxis protein
MNKFKEVSRMKWFNNLKISAKLIIGFIVVAVIAGIVGIIGIMNINNINNLDTDMYQRHTVQISQLVPIAEKYQMMRVSLRDVAIMKDTESKNNSIKAINDNYKIVTDNLQEFGKLITDPRVQKEYDILNDAITNKFPAYKDKVIQLATSNQVEQAINTIFADGTALNSEISKSIDTLVSLKIELAGTASDTNSATTNTAIITMILVIIVGIIISMVLGIFISNSIGPSISLMAGIANLLSVGDVNINTLIKEKDYNLKLRKDEVGKLALAFNKLIASTTEQAQIAQSIADGNLTVDVAIRSENDLLGKKLHELVEKNNEVLTNIASASEQVATGAKQVSDSSIALSQGATEQASSIEQLTASIEEISAQTKQNAEYANQANGLAKTAKANAVQGNEQMREMLKAMHDINDSSANISKIIKVIDEIAFQTNILALNAAVEAARAGQHGKGFAVVAEEVRNLAARSANAAKETTDMIEGSINKAEGGTRIANETANALTKIVEEITKVASLVNDITVASNEQATGIAQINQGVMQVSQVVQTNSATSEESAAASEELSSQAELLKEQVSRFKLKKETRYASYRGLDEINPDVLRMLETMSQNKKLSGNAAEEAHTEAATSASNKIALSDSEFGKY